MLQKRCQYHLPPPPSRPRHIFPTPQQAFRDDQSHILSMARAVPVRCYVLGKVGSDHSSHLPPAGNAHRQEREREREREARLFLMGRQLIGGVIGLTIAGVRLRTLGKMRATKYYKHCSKCFMHKDMLAILAQLYAPCSCFIKWGNSILFQRCERFSGKMVKKAWFI